MTFVENAYTDYAEPKLDLYLMHDDEGTPFLLLHGLEPDREWEAFTAAVRSLVDHFQVSLTVGMHGIPMAVPHTRPATVTAHATRPELVAAHTPWIGRVEVPSSAVALLEYRLGEAGHDVIGFGVHVPSYLAQSEYPRAAIAASATWPVPPAWRCPCAAWRRAPTAPTPRSRSRWPPPRRSSAW